MSWTINFMVMLLLTTITGSILLGTWYWIGRFLERIGYINILYRILYLIIFLFLFPLAYLIIYYDSYILSKEGSILLLTPFILVVSRVFCFIWFLGVCVMVGKYVYELKKLNRRYQTCFPCDLYKQTLFNEICRELGIKEGKIELSQSYYVHISEFGGILRPKVVLPVEQYSDEELRVMFIHELIHYKQRDTWLKGAATIILITQFFNPVVWWLHGLLRRWSEYSCDDKSCQIVGGIKKYFIIISKIVLDINKIDSYFISHLVENKCELAERMEHMRKNHLYKRKSLKVAMGICMVMLFASSGMVYAASANFVEQYETLYDNTVVDIEEENIEVSYVEYTDSGVEDGIAVVDMDTEVMSKSTASFNLAVKGKTMYKSGTFSASSGGAITITVAISPSDTTVNAGIVEPDGSRRYIQGQKSLYHIFELDQTGDYRIFIENKSTSEAKVEGTYIVQ